MRSGRSPQSSPDSARRRHADAPASPPRLPHHHLSHRNLMPTAPRRARVRLTGTCEQCKGPCTATATRCIRCRPRRLKPCPQCGVAFWPYQGNPDHANKLCSPKCRREAQLAHLAHLALVRTLTDEQRKDRQQWYRRNRPGYSREKYLRNRDSELRRARAQYYKNPAKYIAKTMHWKRTHGFSVRLDNWSCVECGQMLPPRRRIYCSDLCQGRTARGKLHFLELTKMVHTGQASRSEVEALAEAWRSLRAARRTIDEQFRIRRTANG